MQALLLAAMMSAAVPTDRPIASSIEPVLARMTAGHQTAKVPGFDDVKKPRRERFFGPINLLTGVALGAGAAYDVDTTFRLVGLNGVYAFPQPDGSTRIVTVTAWERTAFYKKAVERGDRGGVWRRKAAVNGAFWVGSHFLRRSRHKPLKVVGWVLPAVLAGLQFKAGRENARQADAIEAQLH